MVKNLNTLMLINSVTQILASSNASMNPFIYGFIWFIAIDSSNFFLAFSRKSVNEEMVRIMTLFCRRLAPVDNRRAHKPHKDEPLSDSTPDVKGTIKKIIKLIINLRRWRSAHRALDACHEL